MAENKSEDFDPVEEARRVVGSVIPEWMLGWVMDFLDADEAPPTEAFKDGLVKVIKDRFENQFDPQLMNVLRDASRFFGPFGVALAACSLVPWPAMAQRLLPRDPQDVFDEVTAKNQELAQVLQTHEDSSWDWMLDRVRELMTNPVEKGLSSEAVKAMTDSIMDSMQNQLAHALRVSTSSASWDDLLKTVEAYLDRGERMRHQVAAAVGASPTHTWETLVGYIMDLRRLVDKSDQRAGRLTEFVVKIAEVVNNGSEDVLDMSDLDKVDFEGIISDITLLMAGNEARVRLAKALNWSEASSWNAMLTGVEDLKKMNQQLQQQVYNARLALNK